jgi:predicted transcriptional regulator of viral defense system
MKLPMGIRAENRKRLELLHRHLKGPFIVSDAAKLWALEVEASRHLLAYLAGRGWLSRVRRDAYITVPLGASAPGEWRGDPWVVAAKTFAPCYLGGWTACEYWDLTEQIFRDIVVITSHKVTPLEQEIQGTKFRIKVIGAKKFFGFKQEWREEIQVSVSDPSRTIVDLMDDPSLGGGMRNCSQMLRTYFSGNMRNDADVVDYATRAGNRTVFKRLGYLLEAMKINAPTIVDACQKGMSVGISLLDPGMNPEGKILKRWNLRLNSALVEEEA